MTDHFEHPHLQPDPHEPGIDETAFSGLLSNQLPSAEETWRMLHNGPADHELLLANLDLPPRAIALGGIRHASRLLADIRSNEHDGYTGGLDVTPTRLLGGQLARLSGTMPMVDDRDLIGGLHQSRVSGPATMARQGAYTMTGISTWATMPERTASLAVMERIISRIGPVATTAFVDANGRHAPVAFGSYGLHPAVQISPDMLRALEPSTIPGEQAGWWRVLRAHGVSGVVVDSLDLVRPSELPSGIAPLQLDPDAVLETVAQQAIPVRAIHVSVGRSDTKDRQTRQDSQRELTALLDGPDSFAASRAGHIIARAYDIWRGQIQSPEVRPPFVIPVSVEIPFNGLQQALAGQGRPQGTTEHTARANFVAAHRDITEVLHDFFGRLKAKADHDFAFRR